MNAVPVSDVIVPVRSRRSSTGTFNNSSHSLNFEMLPPITTEPCLDAQALLIKKIRQCNVCFNFGNSLEAVEAKEAKRKTLLEIVHYVVAFPNCLTSDVYKEIRIMVENNVWRALPPKQNTLPPEDLDVEELETVDDLAWPHLHVVYELMMRVLESPNFDKKVAKDAFPESFVQHLLQMLDSEDVRERAFLKMIVHRLYGKMVHLRMYVREQMGYFLQDYIQQQNVGSGEFAGVTEMLEILGSIIEGFAVPLKPQHIDYLNQILLPLCKMPAFVLYHAPLLHCMIHFLVKDSSLAKPMLRYFFRHWPVQTARKQVIMLNCIEHIICNIDQSALSDAAPYLFAHLAKTLRSTHFQVADRCFTLIENEKLKEYARRNSTLVVKLLYPELVVVVRDHWNAQLQQAAYTLQKWFEKINSSATAELAVTAAASKPATTTATSSKPDSVWAKLAALEEQPRTTTLSRSTTSSRQFIKSVSLDPETSQLLAKHLRRSTNEQQKENMANY